MRYFLVLGALAMPVIAFLSQRGVFGPDNGTVSDRYPTLLVAAGYAFAIWSVIFLLDLAFAAWQLRVRKDDPALDKVRSGALQGFGFTAVWMIFFSKLYFWLALAVMVLALVSMLWATIAAADAPAGSAAGHPLVRWALGMHAGWLSLAAFLNIAQVIVAQRLLPTDDMLAWSVVLWLLAGALVLLCNRRVRAHPAYWLPVVWGLVGAVVGQARNPLPGALPSAIVAALLAIAVVAQALLWRRKLRRSPMGGAAQASGPRAADQM